MYFADKNMLQHIDRGRAFLSSKRFHFDGERAGSTFRFPVASSDHRPHRGGRCWGASSMALTGSDLVAQALQKQGVEAFFYIMGAPMLSVESAALALGLRGIDVRHEQAAAMAAHAYA